MKDIILKFDDFIVMNNNWQYIIDVCFLENVKASFGVIVNKAPVDFDVKRIHESEVIEFWNHGFKHIHMKNLNFCEQLNLLKQGQIVGKDKFGIVFKTFGPPYNYLNEDTLKVLDDIEDFRTIFFPRFPIEYYAQLLCEYSTDKLVMPITMNMDKYIFNEFVLRYRSGGDCNVAYECSEKLDIFPIVLQGHPNGWSRLKRELFKEIILYLKDEGCMFFTPYEYYKIKRTIL